ncbi:hypothetical protein [Verminephrobacter eiseniae]|uniref:hypothetical protein n=1 Tax=Verminephrobacter eiseniae TaxID=364317 RepID=UPI0012EE26B2|nr:hypothetical protein [Verminephrobacter eiseniae]
MGIFVVAALDAGFFLIRAPVARSFSGRMTWHFNKDENCSALAGGGVDFRLHPSTFILGKPTPAPRAACS